MFEKLHNLAHPGRRATVRMISKRYFWPKMKTDIVQFQKNCHLCQKTKIQRHTKQEIGVFPTSDKFEHVHIDLVLLSDCEGYWYVVTMVDRATKWVEAIPIKEMSAETVADAFVRHWVSKFGVPLKLTTDRGAQFTSMLFSEFTKMLGITQIKTTSYNPKANGAVERIHRTLKQALKCQGEDWIRKLPIVLLGMRAAPRENGVSSAELVFAEKLKLPGEFFTSSEEETDKTEYVKKIRNAFRANRLVERTTAKRKIFVHPDLRSCKKVYVRVDRVRTPLEAPYEGPYRVIKRSKHWFKLEMNGRKDTVNIDRLKPAYELENLEEFGKVKNEDENDADKRKEKKRVKFVKVPYNNPPHNPINPLNSPQRLNPAEIPLPPSPADVPLPPSPQPIRSSRGRIIRPPNGYQNCC